MSTKGGWFFYTSPWRRLLIAATEEAHHANDHTNPQNETTFSSWWLGCPPIPVTVRITMFLVGDPYKPSFATFTGRGDNPSWWFQTIWKICSSNWIISPGRGKKEKKHLEPPSGFGHAAYHLLLHSSYILPRRRTWNLKMTPLKRNIIFQPCIFELSFKIYAIFSTENNFHGHHGMTGQNQLDPQNGPSNNTFRF